MNSLRIGIAATGRWVAGAVNLLEACQVVIPGRKGFSLYRRVPIGEAVRRAQETLERIERSRIEIERNYGETEGCRR